MYIEIFAIQWKLCYLKPQVFMIFNQTETFVKKRKKRKKETFIILICEEIEHFFQN